MLRRAAILAARAAVAPWRTGSSAGASAGAGAAASAPAIAPPALAASAAWASPPPPTALLALPASQTPSLSSGARAMSAIVDVNRNNVDQAFARLRRQMAEAGLPEDLRRRRCFVPTADRTHERRKTTFNRRMGALIRQRLGWVMRRRKVKV